MATGQGNYEVVSSSDSFTSVKSQLLNRHVRTTPQNPKALLEEVAISSSNTELQRTHSKGRIRGIFARSKPVQPSVKPVGTSQLQNSRSQLPERQSLPATVPTKSTHSAQSSLPKAPSNKVPNLTTAKVSRMPTLRSKSIRQPPTTKFSPNTAATPICTPPRRTSAAWDPPPLFQAYPQAIKHATLWSLSLSADSILRISIDKKNGNLKSAPGTMRFGIGRPEEVSAAKQAEKVEKARSKHRRRVSGSISKADWTQKIYMLVTSGYLLQYSAEGSFDRLPEKMMQLGKDSVAFASDVIPGKHWVLQISQSLGVDGAPSPDARSLMSRLTFRGADYRRTATSFLLVLDNADDLESWIITVRREIEALGGKECVSETGTKKFNDDGNQIKPQTSQRYLVKRDPDRFSNPSTPVAPPQNHLLEPVNNQSQQPSGADTVVTNTRPSEDTLSATASVASHGSPRLDSLNDRSNRFSYRSSGTRTLVTSRGSSPSSSKGSAFTIEEATPINVTEEVRLRPNAMAINDRRRSMQTLRIPELELQNTSSPVRPRPHSTYTGPGRHSLVYSPSTPNFSVPHAMRYVHTKNTSKTTTMLPRSPGPIPRSPGSTARAQERMPKGNRKASPAPLITHPHVAIQGSSPVKLPSVYTSTGGSLKMMQVRKPAVVNISATSPTPKLSPSAINESMKGRLPGNTCSPGLPHMDFHFPRRQSSKNFLSVTPATFSPSTKPQSPAIIISPESIPLPSSPVLGPTDKQSKDIEIINANPQVLPALLEQLDIEPQPHDDKEGAVECAIGAPIVRVSKDILSPPLSTTTPVLSSPVIKEPLCISPTFSAPNPSRLPSFSRPLASPSSQKALTSPSFQKPLASPTPSLTKLKAASTSITSRRSMPHLPPPAPPPNCALPPLPEVSKSPLHSPLHSPLSGKMDLVNKLKA